MALVLTGLNSYTVIYTNEVGIERRITVSKGQDISALNLPGHVVEMVKDIKVRFSSNRWIPAFTDTEPAKVDPAFHKHGGKISSHNKPVEVSPAPESPVEAPEEPVQTAEEAPVEKASEAIVAMKVVEAEAVVDAPVPPKEAVKKAPAKKASTAKKAPAKKSSSKKKSSKSKK